MTVDTRPLRPVLDFILYFYTIIINKSMCRRFTPTDRHVKKKNDGPVILLHVRIEWLLLLVCRQFYASAA